MDAYVCLSVHACGCVILNKQKKIFRTIFIKVCD